MIFSLKKLSGVFGLALFLATACSKIENANFTSQTNRTADVSDERKNSLPVKDDVEELGKIVKLPFTPEEATWRDDNSTFQTGANKISEPEHKKLTAVLKFSAEDARKIAEQAQKYRPATAAEVDAEMWFPAELIAQSQLSGDESLKGASFAADDFFQTPYTTGKITRVDDSDFFVLELAAR